MAENPSQNVRKRQRVSKVWDHYILKEEENKVQCVYCKADLAYHCSTTSMIQHLNRKHPHAVSPRVAETSTSQRSMDSFVRPAQSCTVQEATIFTESILNMIVTDMRPLSMVEDKGFRDMISTFNSKYNMPSRTYFTQLMEKKHQEIKEKLKVVLKETECVALTTDIWTSVATEAYLGVTCHFLGEDWEMKSLSLTTMPLEERHTAANIADWLEETTAKFQIPFEKVKAVVHDNGANVVAAARILRERHGWASVRCAGHTLNLVVQSTLKNNKTIASCVGSARCLVEHFKKSELACTKLKEKQQHQKATTDVDTGCQYPVEQHISHAIKTPGTAMAPVNPRGKHHYLDLKPEQWNISEELTQVLGPFEGATEFLSGEQYVTLSALPQLVQNLKKSTLTAELETAPVKAFQASAAEQITERWQELYEFLPDTPNPFLLAAALDPRFRKLKFLPTEEVLKVQTSVQSMALAAKKDSKQTHVRVEEATATTSATHTTGGSHRRSILGSSSEDEDEAEDEQMSRTVQKEVLDYFGEQPISKKENPLPWWRINQARYPTLAQLAKSFLGIPATSTPSGRLFSAAGNIASKRRASLSAEHVTIVTQ
ncbi:Zinc finger BED domain-containing protein 1 [Merluccius polli]|uniref:Zinc finger BED domain-containing protein 1 n=1 Tax=Merluccius polli TaxID=89951 RepID=A0AA47M5N4_MERPO|nr:Zinc finger BED domain-containing protein 1 [Merluccius polli]